MFDLSDIPNSEHLEPGFHEFQIVAELERRVELRGRTRRLRLTGFDSRGRMGLLDQAVVLAQAMSSAPDAGAIRAHRSRLGASMSRDQTLDDTVGIFARLGKAAGNVETYEFGG